MASLTSALELTIKPDIDILHKQTLTKYNLRTENGKYILSSDMYDAEEIDEVFFNASNQDILLLKLNDRYVEFMTI